MRLITEHVTLRAITSAILIGCGICFANIYFGLQAGIVNAMPMPAALVGFAMFKYLEPHFNRPLSPQENTVIQVVAGALGAMPLTSGFSGVIPALEFLATPDVNGPYRFSNGQLIFWSLGVCFLGTVVAAPFRKLFIVRERLRYPSATATGVLIGLLHGDSGFAKRADLNQIVDDADNTETQTVIESEHAEARSSSNDLADEHGIQRIHRGSDLANKNMGEQGVKTLLFSFLGSSIFTVLSYFIPVVTNAPIFGVIAAKKWLWAFNFSPAYFGYGMIIKPSSTFHMLLGTIVGWGILSPMAHSKGWAPGPVDNWKTGSRGWIFWTSVGLMLGDSIVGLCWLVSRPSIASLQRYYKSRNRELSNEEERAQLLPGANERVESDTTPKLKDDWLTSSAVTPLMTTWFSLAAFVLAFSIFYALFGSMTVGGIVVALLAVPLMSLISMRSLGETDSASTVPISRLMQFLFGAIVSSTNPSAIIVNIVMGGVAEAGAWQASQQMGDLKTASLTKTAPRAIYFGQMIGSFFGVFVGSFAYRLYTSVKTIPSSEFPVPDAHIWLVAARLIYGEGLPPQAFNFAVGATVIGAFWSVLRVYGEKKWWRDFVPSGIAVAVGMYLVPAITLTRACGGLIYYYCHTRLKINELTLICSASGLVLGQGIFSLLNLALDAFHVPHL